MLDIILPGMDGFAVLRHLRARRLTGRVLMLTARRRSNGPCYRATTRRGRLPAKAICNGRIGCARKRAGTRYPEEPALKLRVGDLTLDLEPGRVFTRTELCERVWEHPHEYDTKLVEVFIGTAKEKNWRTSPDSYGAPLVTGVLLFPNCTKLSAITRCGY